MPARRKLPPPTTILLVRHGQTPTTGKHLPGRAPGLHLSDDGTLQGLAAEHPGGVVVAVSHADPIRAAIADAMGTHLDMFQRIVVGTASVTAIAYGQLAPVLLT